MSLRKNVIYMFICEEENKDNRANFVLREKIEDSIWKLRGQQIV
jgi:hypothetical protein